MSDLLIRLETAPTPAIAKGPKPLCFATCRTPLWPFPQKWPGAPADGCDCIWEITAGSNEYSNRYWPLSPESGLEDVPRRPIAVNNGPVC